MNDKYKLDCQLWAGGKASLWFRLKHYLFFPSFRIITWKRIGESTNNPLIRGLVKYKLLKYANKYLITLPLKTVVGGVFPSRMEVLLFLPEELRLVNM